MHMSGGQANAVAEVGQDVVNHDGHVVGRRGGFRYLDGHVQDVVHDKEQQVPLRGSGRASPAQLHAAVKLI